MGDFAPGIGQLESASSSEVVITVDPYEVESFDGSDITVILDNPTSNQITIDSITVDDVEEV